jgi:uncharacterized protein (TIGR02001 family)
MFVLQNTYWRFVRNAALAAIAAFIVADNVCAGDGGIEAGGDLPPGRARPGRFGDISYAVQAAAVSDYIARGFSQTSGAFAVQAKGEVWDGPFFGGIRASNTDFTRNFRNNAARLGSSGKAGVEFNTYAGAAPAYGDASFLLMAMFTAYPDANYAGSHFNYAEFRAGVKGHVLDYIDTGFNVYYSPDYFANSGENWVVEGTLAYTLPKISTVTPALSSAAGYQMGDDVRNGFNYWYWNTGITLTYAGHYMLDVRYHDTAGVPFSCTDQCGTRLVAGIKVAF